MSQGSGDSKLRIEKCEKGIKKLRFEKKGLQFSAYISKTDIANLQKKF